MYINGETLSCTPETNIILHVTYISLKKKKKKKLIVQPEGQSMFMEKTPYKFLNGSWGTFVTESAIYIQYFKI